MNEFQLGILIGMGFVSPITAFFGIEYYKIWRMKRFFQKENKKQFTLKIPKETENLLKTADSLLSKYNTS